MCQKSEESRYIDTREIRVPEVMKVGTSEVSKTQGVIRNVHQRRTCGSNQSHRGKSRQEVVYRHFGHRDIGNPGDKRFGHFGIAKSETSTRRKVPLWAICQPIGIREDRESREPMHCDIEKLETPMKR
jgi:hypothetical protein